MASTNIVGLIQTAEERYSDGPMKRKWVLDQLGGVNGLNQELAGDIVDDIVQLMNSREMSKLVLDGGRFCTVWCCRSRK